MFLENTNKPRPLHRSNALQEWEYSFLLSRSFHIDSQLDKEETVISYIKESVRCTSSHQDSVALARAHLPRKRKPMPLSSSSFKCKLMAEMEALPHLTGREQRPRETNHFILPGAQGQPIANTMADPQSHLLSTAPPQLPLPQRAPTQDRANAIVNPNPFPVKGKKDFPAHDINISCLLVFLSCCYQSEKQQQRRRLVPYSLPSSNEGERGDREIPNTLVFIKIRELN